MGNQSHEIKYAIAPPEFDPAKLHRARLVDLIHANLPSRLIVIIAPAGYGKTTLLADFTAHTEFCVCWVRISEADQDPSRFAEVLCASLIKRFRRLRGLFDTSAYASYHPKALARAILDVIEERVSEPFIIILDDTHLLNPSQDALEFIDTLIAEGPDRMTVIATGRELPDISMAKLVVNRQMAGLGASDLALSREELEALAKEQMGVKLSSSDMDAIISETEGWIVGVLFSGILSHDVGLPLLYQKSLVNEYLASTVFEQLPHEKQQFAAEASVLPVMTVRSCDITLNRKDSQQQLDALIQKGAFITASGTVPRSYTFHPIYREFLLENLSEKDPDLMRSLRMRGADYYADQNSPALAVELYLEADDVNTAVQLVESECRQLFDHGRFALLKRWSARLKELERATPNLDLHLANAMVDKGELGDAEQLLARAAVSLEVEPSPAKRRLLASLEAIRGRIALERGLLEDAREAADRALGILPKRGESSRRAACYRIHALALYQMDDNPQEAERYAMRAVDLFQKAKDEYLLANAYLDLSMIQQKCCKPHLARKSCDQAHKLLKKLRSPLPLAICLNNLAVFNHQSGNYDEAIEQFQDGLKHAYRAASPRYEMLILFGQADLFNDLGVFQLAGNLYGKGLTLAGELNNQSFFQYGCIGTAIMHRRNGSLIASQEWLDRAKKIEGAQRDLSNITIQEAGIQSLSFTEIDAKNIREIEKEHTSYSHKSQLAMFLYFLARSDYMHGRLKSATRRIIKSLDLIEELGAEQLIAAELMHDAEMQTLSVSETIGHLLLPQVLQRIEIMRAVARRYGEEKQSDKARTLVVHAMGKTEIHFRGTKVTGLRPLARQILFYIVDQGPIARDKILETFWPDTTIGKQIASLYTSTHNLRDRFQQNLIVIEGGRYQINPEIPLEYDVAEFEQSVEVAKSLGRGDPRRFFAYEDAAQSYRGDFLAEYVSDWTLDRSRVLQQIYLEILADYSEEAISIGKLRESGTSLRKALEIDPYRDDLNRLYLEVLDQMGHRSEIIRHYEQYTRILHDELDLPPSDEISNLYELLLK